MTTSTIRSRRQQRGFTLVEILIGATLGSMILAAVLTTFLMLGRSGANAANYSMMETQARRALEDFSQDLRTASSVTWNSSTSITLLVPNSYTTTSNLVTYAYDSSSQIFYRLPGDGTDSDLTHRYQMIRKVATFTYSRYDRVDNPATSDIQTKRIQLSMVVRTTDKTVVNATNNILSASFILRNKPVN